MSRRDEAKRKKRELKKKEARKAADFKRLQQKRAARDSVQSVEKTLERLKLLFNEEAPRAIQMALDETLDEEEIARRLKVSPERVTELLDLAGGIPEQIVDYFRKYPDVMSNPEVLSAIIAGLKQKGLR